MSPAKKIGAGITRTDLTMADGRTIRYYDTQGQLRNAEDKRPPEAQPGIGELRLDPLVNEWVVMAAHRQGRVFLPPKELCPLCPTKGELLTEIPDSNYESEDWELLGVFLLLPKLSPPHHGAKLTERQFLFGGVFFANN